MCDRGACRPHDRCCRTHNTLALRRNRDSAVGSRRRKTISLWLRYNIIKTKQEGERVEGTTLVFWRRNSSWRGSSTSSTFPPDLIHSEPSLDGTIHTRLYGLGRAIFCVSSSLLHRTSRYSIVNVHPRTLIACVRSWKDLPRHREIRQT